MDIIFDGSVRSESGDDEFSWHVQGEALAMMDMGLMKGATRIPFLPKPCSKPRTANLPTANTDDFAKPLAEAVAQEKKMTPRSLGIICRVHPLSINFSEEILD